MQNDQKRNETRQEAPLDARSRGIHVDMLPHNAPLQKPADAGLPDTDSAADAPQFKLNELPKAQLAPHDPYNVGVHGAEPNNAPLADRA